MYPVGVYETSKSINESFDNMRCLVLFTIAVCFIFLLTMCKCNIFINAAVCVLFLINLRWPKSKSIYETSENSVAMPPPLSPTICSFSLNILLFKEARKGFFGCYSVCETMKDTKEG